MNTKDQDVLLLIAEILLLQFTNDLAKAGKFVEARNVVDRLQLRLVELGERNESERTD